ncbi:MAG: cob(I)yrinic acid a,c-diamide adenosyltransferase [SAR202 cluster bacterium]|nr:ATP:cob(I)alamin adenosyltransferase [Dehalococcoidia bacterium]MBS20058.1 ATP:cob(I)alamin adenosyltransferase [Chloroflexota bacterium]MQG22650.1 cob(I)yrinic acid a,c-diamide adenosyltransferase [SAR202 cluster bacterium]
MKIYTKTGDDGTTGLFFGGRVYKNDIRCEAYGEIDKTVAALGLARSLVNDDFVKELLIQLQNELFTVGAELATLEENYETMSKSYKIISSDMISNMEDNIDQLMKEVTLPPNFILPGASAGSSALDLARTTLRSAERRVVGLSKEGLLVNSNILVYINRLSDLLFILARFEDRDLPVEIITGQKKDE